MNILVVTGKHPKDVIGGSELQAHLIAQVLKSSQKNTIFCAVLSDCDQEKTEKDGLKYIGINGSATILTRTYKFSRLLRNFRPDVIYVRCLYSFWWINLISKFMKIRTIFQIHSISHCQYLTLQDKYIIVYKKENGQKYFLKILKKMLLHNLYVSSIRCADAIICQTLEQCRLLKKNLNLGATIIRNGLPLPLPLTKKFNEEFNVIWIGKYWKNPAIFVDLAKKFSGNVDVKFWMVGIFPKKIEGFYVMAERVLPNFSFWGEVPYDEVNEMLRKSHLLVNTSDYEGFPNTFIQAWLHRVPVLSLNIDPDDIMKSNRIGFHSKTIDQLEKDLRMLTENKKLYMECSKRSYTYACKEHDIVKTTKSIFKLMKEVLRNGGKNEI